MLTKQIIIEVLGMEENDFEDDTPCSFQEATRKLNAFKKKAKAKYRQAIKIHHPDKGGDNEICLKIQEVYDQIKKMEVKRIIPNPMPFSFNMAGGSIVIITGTNSSTSTVSGSSGATFFQMMYKL